MNKAKLVFLVLFCSLLLNVIFLLSMLFNQCGSPKVEFQRVVEYVNAAPTLPANSKRTFEVNPLLRNQNFYDERYWSYQESLGAFGGKAEAFKFRELIKETDTLIDYGGGGGFLLNNLKADRKILIEPNPHARKHAKNTFHLETYASPEDTPSTLQADIIISNHCLEHVPNPLEELTKLRQLLKKGGIICIVVPVDAALGTPYSTKDINHHIYTWNALLLGNLVADAGFVIETSEEISYQWPSHFESVWNDLGEEGFLKTAHEQALQNGNKQVRLVAVNPE